MGEATNVYYAINHVSVACREHDVGEEAFWHWLGNAKFAGDVNLTETRAYQIVRDVHDLIKEFTEEDSSDTH